MIKLLYAVFFLLAVPGADLFAAKYWSELRTDFRNKKVGEFPSVALVDIDADGDWDMTIGNWEGYLEFYRNVKNNRDPEFVMESSGVSIKSSFQGVSTMNAAVPFWVDIDGDGDADLFLGNITGCIAFYENTGTPGKPRLKCVNKGDSRETSYFNIDAGYNSIPVFVDIDGDNDYDLFIGERDGTINYYQNIGDARTPVFQEVRSAESPETSYNEIDVGECSSPFFVDIDRDNDLDLFIGNWEGHMFYYRNDGTKFEPFFKEVNYAVSPETSFNQYRSEGDCRFVIAPFEEKAFDFIFFRMNGVLTWYRTTGDFKILASAGQRMDVTLKMANYYYEKAKEEYLESRSVEAKILLLKAKKYSDIKKVRELLVKCEAEIKETVSRVTGAMKGSFIRGNFIEAMEYLLSENYMKASVMFNQIKKSYNPNGLMDGYIRLADRYEQERKKIIRAETLDNEAISLYKQGRYTDALKKWEQASVYMPDDYTIVENIIMCKAAMDEMETSQVITKMVQDVSNYIRRGDRENALKVYVKLMDMGSIPAKVRSEINRLKNDIMSFKEAAHDRNIETLYQNGLKSLSKGQYEQAVDFFKKVVFYKGSYKDVNKKLNEAKKHFMEREKLK